MNLAGESLSGLIVLGCSALSSNNVGVLNWSAVLELISYRIESPISPRAQLIIPARTFSILRLWTSSLPTRRTAVGARFSSGFAWTTRGSQVFIGFRMDNDHD